MKTYKTQRTSCYSLNCRLIGESGGFSLVELLIAMVVSLILLGAVYSVFNVQHRIFTAQEDYVELQQGIRAAMDLMTREIGMAGYDPSGNANAGIVAAGANSLNFTMDLTGNGNTNDPNENIMYSLYTADGIQRLGRRSTAGAVNQPVAEHVTALVFSYGPGNRTVTITLTGRTARPDPAGGFRTFTLTQVVTPRNLAF